MSAPPLRAVIVDDEPLARTALRILLDEERGVTVVDEAGDGEEAVARITSLQPDLVFLDVQMPGCDGFEVVRRVAESHLPYVIFVSAYDQYALRAFEVHALDYLLKPVTRDRLHEAVARARSPIVRGDPHAARSLLGLVEHEATPPGAPLRRLVVRDRQRFLLLRDEELAWVEAAGNYAGLHARGQVFLIRGTLRELERRLDPARFRRIHRSAIVNLDQVREITPDGTGDFSVHLADGTVLTLSRSYRDALLPRG